MRTQAQTEDQGLKRDQEEEPGKIKSKSKCGMKMHQTRFNSYLTIKSAYRESSKYFCNNGAQLTRTGWILPPHFLFLLLIIPSHTPLLVLLYVLLFFHFLS
jgi:hypothetical protein